MEADALDKRLELVLGKFQERYKGSLTREKLGPCFGPYGTFLPTRQAHADPNLQAQQVSIARIAVVGSIMMKARVAGKMVPPPEAHQVDLPPAVSSGAAGILGPGPVPVGKMANPVARPNLVPEPLPPAAGWRSQGLTPGSQKNGPSISPPGSPSLDYIFQMLDKMWIPPEHRLKSIPERRLPSSRPPPSPPHPTPKTSPLLLNTTKTPASKPPSPIKTTPVKSPQPKKVAPLQKPPPLSLPPPPKPEPKKPIPASKPAPAPPKPAPQPASKNPKPNPPRSVPAPSALPSACTAPKKTSGMKRPHPKREAAEEKAAEPSRNLPVPKVRTELTPPPPKSLKKAPSAPPASTPPRAAPFPTKKVVNGRKVAEKGGKGTESEPVSSKPDPVLPSKGKAVDGGKGPKPKASGKQKLGKSEKLESVKKQAKPSSLAPAPAPAPEVEEVPPHASKKKREAENPKSAASSASKSEEGGKKGVVERVSGSPAWEGSAATAEAAGSAAGAGEGGEVPATDLVAWVACDNCDKWRLLPLCLKITDLPKYWSCSMNYWVFEDLRGCDIEEEATGTAPPIAPLPFLPEEEVVAIKGEMEREREKERVEREKAEGSSRDKKVVKGNKLKRKAEEAPPPNPAAARPVKRVSSKGKSAGGRKEEKREQEKKEEKEEKEEKVEKEKKEEKEEKVEKEEKEMKEEKVEKVEKAGKGEKVEKVGKEEKEAPQPRASQAEVHKVEEVPLVAVQILGGKGKEKEGSDSVPAQQAGARMGGGGEEAGGKERVEKEAEAGGEGRGGGGGIEKDVGAEEKAEGVEAEAEAEHKEVESVAEPLPGPRESLQLSPEPKVGGSVREEKKGEESQSWKEEGERIQEAEVAGRKVEEEVVASAPRLVKEGDPSSPSSSDTSSFNSQSSESGEGEGDGKAVGSPAISGVSSSPPPPILLNTEMGGEGRERSRGGAERPESVKGERGGEEEQEVRSPVGSKEGGRGERQREGGERYRRDGRQEERWGVPSRGGREREGLPLYPSRRNEWDRDRERDRDRDRDRDGRRDRERSWERSRNRDRVGGGVGVGVGLGVGGANRFDDRRRVSHSREGDRDRDRNYPAERERGGYSAAPAAAPPKGEWRPREADRGGGGEGSGKHRGAGEGGGLKAGEGGVRGGCGAALPAAPLLEKGGEAKGGRGGVEGAGGEGGVGFGPGGVDRRGHELQEEGRELKHEADKMEQGSVVRTDRYMKAALKFLESLNFDKRSAWLDEVATLFAFCAHGYSKLHFPGASAVSFRCSSYVRMRHCRGPPDAKERRGLLEVLGPGGGGAKRAGGTAATSASASQAANGAVPGGGGAQLVNPIPPGQNGSPGSSAASDVDNAANSAVPPGTSNAAATPSGMPPVNPGPQESTPKAQALPPPPPLPPAEPSTAPPASFSVPQPLHPVCLRVTKDADSVYSAVEEFQLALQQQQHQGLSQEAETAISAVNGNMGTDPVLHVLRKVEHALRVLGRI